MYTTDLHGVDPSIILAISLSYFLQQNINCKCRAIDSCASGIIFR